MKRQHILCFILLAASMLSMNVTAQNEYTQRFLDLRAKMNDPDNGYFSKDGVPYHSVETLMCEAPDYGHETTSEAYSYWIWMEAMYGGITGDWTYLNDAWTTMEEKAIPTSAMQPTAKDYDPSDPADYVTENPLPDNYPSALESGIPVGEDPISEELTAAYGNEVYAMHWLFDCDNFYGYGNMGDGESTPSYINTFQRGEQESVWETVPHPSWEDFSWGADNAGFLSLFVDDPNPTKQWRYTNAPDADARAVQAMYWAVEFAKEQGLDPKTTIPTEKASKMGDFVRLAMFDKYFKPIGAQNVNAAGATGYNSAHYLLSWYFAWGGPLTSQNWAWRIGCSHNHFGYQNPVAAYALSETEELKPKTANGARDWGKSLERQLEFYTWLQSAEGGIAGGATNSLNGNYSAYPSGTATFYDMAYQEHPVYHDPGSNQWFGMQAWSMERIAELYYIDNNEMAKKLLDKWVAWVKSEVKLTDDGDYQIPATLKWEGQPETWNPSSPAENVNLHVTVTDYSHDAGVAGCLAKALTYYAAGTRKYDTLDDEARELAKQILDRMWNKFYEEDGLGITVEETRSDYSRFFEQEVYVPSGYSGKMANGDEIKSGVKFIDIRSEYKNDPAYADLKAAYDAGEDYKVAYHRYWAQADIALANAEYGRLFGAQDTVDVSGLTINPTELSLSVGKSETLTATVSPINATNKKVNWVSSNTSIATVDGNGKVTAVALGSATITATTEDGGFEATCSVTVSTTPSYTLLITTVGEGSVELDPLGSEFLEGTSVTLNAIAGGGYSFVKWTGDLSGSENPATIVMDSNKEISAIFEEAPEGCPNPISIGLTHKYDGVGEFCWVTDEDIAHVNSWNVSKLEINGVDFTNTWSNSMPAKVDGKYVIQYVGEYDWSHVEIVGGINSTLKSNTTTDTKELLDSTIKLYPNPASSEVTVLGVSSVKHVKLVTTSGQIVFERSMNGESSLIIPLDAYGNGMYFISFITDDGTSTTKKLLIK